MKKHITTAFFLIVFGSSTWGKEAWSDEEPRIVQPPTVKIQTFFCTDRKRITSNLEDEGAELSARTNGYANVRVPINQEWLDKGTLSLKPQLQALGWQIDRSNPTQLPFIEVRGYVAETNPQMMLSNVETGADFWDRLSTQVQSSINKTIYVYIHGFASSGNNAVYSAGLLSANVEAPVVAFTWPSQGSAGLKPFRLTGKKRTRALYEQDLKMIDQPEVISDLSDFLSELKAKLAPNTRIVLVAHSLGNRLMARYLISDAKEFFDKVVFVAADVNQDLFMDVLKVIRTKARSTVVFANEKDLVLAVSAGRDLLSLKFNKKLGKAKFLVPEIEFVDYEAIAEPTSIDYLCIRHYVPFEHLGSILRKGCPSSDAINQFYLVKNSKVIKQKQ